MSFPNTDDSAGAISTTEVEIAIEDEPPVFGEADDAAVGAVSQPAATLIATVASSSSSSSSPSTSTSAISSDAPPSSPTILNPGGGPRSEAGHFLLTTTGSRGDVQPFLALAVGLVEAGFSCAVATHECFESFVRENGRGLVGFYPLVGNPAAILSSPELRDAFYEDRKLDQLKLSAAEHDKMAEPNMHRGWEACLHAKPDLIVGSIATQFDCISYGQRLGVPVVIACTVPLWPTSEFPPVGTANSAPGWVSMLLYWISNKMMVAMTTGPLNQFRKDVLHLPPPKTPYMGSAPCLAMFSEHVVPRPADYPDYITFTGYWTMPDSDDFQPSAELADFLGLGTGDRAHDESKINDPPVYMGFGSMPLRDIGATAQAFSRVLKRLNKRGILCVGWSDREALTQAGPLGDHVLVIDGAPHEWLLPRCAMAIHHGGAGTTAATLRAGIPCIIFSVLIDQPFWAYRCALLGVGPENTRTIIELSEQTLEEQIVAASNPQMIERAAEMGRKLRAEDGVGNTIRFLKQYLENNRNPGIECKYLPDEAASVCTHCQKEFTFFFRRHHCMSCGGLYCGNCVVQRPLLNHSESVLVCFACRDARGLQKQPIRAGVAHDQDDDTQ